MIQVKLNTILESMDTLKELAQKELKGRTAYQVGKLIKKIDEEFSLFNETREKLIRKYAAVDENGEFILNENNAYTFKDNNYNLFMDEINSLVGTEISIDASPIPLDDISELQFTPAQMVQLDPFIEE